MTIKDGKSRWPTYIALAVSLVIVVGIISPVSELLPILDTKYWQSRRTAHQRQIEGSLLPLIKQDLRIIHDIALKYGTDKVAKHSFEDMHEKYLSKIRYEKVKLLQIGLDCNMASGMHDEA